MCLCEPESVSVHTYVCVSVYLFVSCVGVCLRMPVCCGCLCLLHLRVSVSVRICVYVRMCMHKDYAEINANSSQGTTFLFRDQPLIHIRIMGGCKRGPSEVENESREEKRERRMDEP